MVGRCMLAAIFFFGRYLVLITEDEERKGVQWKRAWLINERCRPDIYILQDIM